MCAAPIGVFDSGVGGLSVLNAISAELPQEHLVYFADTAYAPYGDRSDTEIINRSLKVTEYLVNTGCKAIVIACNTATAAAVRLLREQLDVPIIGIEPGIKPAVHLSVNKRVGVLGTRYTVTSDKFKRLVEPYKQQAEIIIQACPGLVEHLEMPGDQHQAISALLDRFLAPMIEAEVDTLVLGCTHYSFLRDRIQARLASNLVILDTPAAVARELKRRLTELDLLSVDTPIDQSIQYLSTSTNMELARQVMSGLLGKNIKLNQVTE